MRRMSCLLLMSCLFLGLVLVTRAGDDREAQALLDKALKAHLGKAKKDSSSGYKAKNKGKLYILGMDIEFTQEITLDIPKRFKEERLNIMRLQTASFSSLHLFADSEDAAGIHRIVRQCPFLHQILKAPAVECVFQNAIKSCSYFWLLAVPDRLNEKVTQRFAVELELAKHIEHLST